MKKLCEAGREEGRRKDKMERRVGGKQEKSSDWEREGE